MKKTWRVTPRGFEHDMSPFFMGLAAAEFLPADPAVWFEAACAARMTFMSANGKALVFKTANEAAAHAEFLRGLLSGTVGGCEAVGAWMLSRGFVRIQDGAHQADPSKPPRAP